jgi:hypothetical protein
MADLRILPFFSTTLVAPLTLTGTVLPVAPNVRMFLSAQLGGMETFLGITSPVGVEVVKASVDPTSGLVYLVRGQDGTTPREFPAGACVVSAWTQCAVEQLICQFIRAGTCA